MLIVLIRFAVLFLVFAVISAILTVAAILLGLSFWWAVVGGMFMVLRFARSLDRWLEESLVQ